MKLSSMSTTQLADALGAIKFEKDRFAAMEDRIKEMLKSKTSSDRVYGNAYTVEFKEKSRTNFDKKEFVAKYGQKVYDKYTYKSGYVSTIIEPVEKKERAKDETVLRMNISGFGEVSAGRV